MGWFSSFTNWLVDDVLGIDLPDPNANAKASSDAAAKQEAAQTALTEQTNALKTQNAIAQKSADDALIGQKKALAVSEAALMPNMDSESARAASDTKQRKLQMSSPWGIGMQKKLGAAPVGFRVLSGQ